MLIAVECRNGQLKVGLQPQEGEPPDELPSNGTLAHVFVTLAKEFLEKAMDDSPEPQGPSLVIAKSAPPAPKLPKKG